ncbi:MULTISPECIES: hypothetical protein [Phyllobacteriaceae]|jgi:hypothetical protein|uniref:Uncharacterized protein n=1 Tax=Mesorhizobium hungaricum TaxID=1566387 RepID=A0A1C2DD24_9HYPH|nr:MULTISPECIES: hypothetical protein [Mesorhizobium]MBN9235120.1 hypothetical protein [Mesorhizobium sp.]OCX12681.1 hypothetical protein QV13_24090 [Mesorhizobium hungaricum]
MKRYHVAVSTRCTEYHVVTAASPAAALAAYHADQTTLADDQVDGIEGIRVIDLATNADVTIVANQPVIQ